ncbi:MAG: recombination regulator RecX [Betaproteobacteria bacterium]|nr:recombination regulator RecX [Betaproteobacteria bacterium]MBV9360788.1 recombination regulator RecX [Betaproteobacteria bacterium]
MKSERPDTPVELKVRALRFLVRREHSRAELARKLLPHAESPASIEDVLNELAIKRQLSDERYAEVRTNWLARKYGAAKIRHDLKAHGVAEAVVERVSAEGDYDRAKAIVARKYRGAATTREEKAKRARFLQSRGFSYDVIRRVIDADPESI